MRTTLYYIPHECLGLTVFGFGWVLIIWAMFSVALLGWLKYKKRSTNEILGYLPVLSIIGLAVAFLLPMVEVTIDDEVVGLPIRGYGTMVLLGIVAGVGLVVYRARRMGIHPEVMLTLTFWAFLSAIAGARLFFVIQKREQFLKDDFVATLKAVFSITEGGLVVYGAFVGATIVCYFFLKKRKLPYLAIADLVAPSLLVGLALGRIGCLMNGCCFGGVCHDESAFRSLAITFPSEDPPYVPGDSPPYQDQVMKGQLQGIEIGAAQDSSDERPVVVSVDSDRVRDEESGETLAPGDTILAINDTGVKTVEDARKQLAKTGRQITVVTGDGRVVSWQLPERSLPVHPSQIYSAINAALLAAFLWFYYPFRRRDGEVFALMVGIYSIARFLLEMIRDDEGGQFGTQNISISQWVAGALFIGAAALWFYLSRQPREHALPISGAGD